MADIQRLMKIRKFNNSKSQGFEYERKVIKDGNNKFRILDDMPHMTYEHWFTAACGTPVHSVCTRDYYAEMDPDNEDEPKYCAICDLVKQAWDIWNNPEEYSKEEVFEAGVIIGQEVDRKKGFKASWGAKSFAYMNVIDRDDDWCAQNDHSKVLCKTDKQAGITAGKNGQLEEFIELVDENGDWLEYDVRMKKKGKKLDTEYRVYKDKDVELTEEEQAYETYDFNELMKPTKQDVLEKWLSKGVDKKTASSKDEESEDDEPKKKKKKAAKKKTLKRKPQDEEDDESPKKKTKVKLKKKEREEPVEEEEDEEVPEEEAKEVVVEEVEDEVVDEVVDDSSDDSSEATEESSEEEAESEEDDQQYDVAECPECESLISTNSTECDQCGAEFA